MLPWDSSPFFTTIWGICFLQPPNKQNIKANYWAFCSPYHFLVMLLYPICTEWDLKYLPRWMAFIYCELVGKCSSPIRHIWVWHINPQQKITHFLTPISSTKDNWVLFGSRFGWKAKNIHSQYQAPDVSCRFFATSKHIHEPTVALIFRVGVKQRIPNATQTLMVGIIHCACPPTFFTNTHNRLICLYPNQGKWFIVLGAWFWTGWQKQTTPTELLLLSVSRMCGNHVDSNSNSSWGYFQFMQYSS